MPPLSFVTLLDEMIRALAGLFVMLIYLIIALFAPIVAPHDPNFQVSSDAMQSPSWNHWFGTDNAGRDTLSRVIYGTRVSLIVQFTLGIGYAMLVEVGLSFLGLGIQPPTPACGQMVGLARNYITIAPWLSTFPGFATFLALLAFSFLGDGLREATDPRLRSQRPRKNPRK